MLGGHLVWFSLLSFWRYFSGQHSALSKLLGVFFPPLQITICCLMHWEHF